MASGSSSSNTRYRGRPSLGCDTCRQRKIKCDLREGSCENCEKAGWPCGGYRDVQSMMFLDQTASTALKASTPRSRRKPKARSPSTDDSPVQTSTRQRTGSKQPTLLPKPDQILVEVPKTLLPTLGELALGFFFCNFVREYRDRCEQWSVELWSGSLLASIKALGAAGVTGSSTARPEVAGLYSQALHFTNQALTSPGDAKSDRTLLAITILSVFEGVAGTLESLDNWRQHLIGAASLLQLRGLEQFSAPTGCRLALQTLSCIVASSLYHRTPISASVWDLVVKGQDHAPGTDPTIWRCLRAGMKTADLQASLPSNNTPQSAQRAAEIVTQSLQTLSDYIAIGHDARPKWHPKIVMTAADDNDPSTSFFFSNYYFLFDSCHDTLEAFAHTRNCKLVLTALVRTALPLAEPLLTPQQLSSARAAVASQDQAIRDIFATVPQLVHRNLHTLRWKSTPPGGGSTDPDGMWTYFLPSDELQDAGDLPYVHGDWGYHIKFALFQAGRTAEQGTSVRDFAIRALRGIGKRPGTARVLAARLEGEG